jgi:chlorite dismutase
MRFDEASARYAQFGPFYISYIKPIADALKHLRLG